MGAPNARTDQRSLNTGEEIPQSFTLMSEYIPRVTGLYGHDVTPENLVS